MIGSLVAILIIQKNDSADVHTTALSSWYLIELCSLAFNLLLQVWVLLLDGHVPLKLWDMILFSFIMGEIFLFMHV